MEISQYHIHYLLKRYIEQVKIKDDGPQKGTVQVNNYVSDHIIANGIKRSQLCRQLIYEAIDRFTTDVREKSRQKIVGDIIYDLSDANERRKLYGTFIQDSRRR